MNNRLPDDIISISINTDGTFIAYSDDTLYLYNSGFYQVSSTEANTNMVVVGSKFYDLENK